MLIAITLHRRYVVGPQDTIEADVSIGTHACGHIRFALVMKRLYKILRCTFDIAHVNKMNPVLLAKMTNHGWQVIAHQREIPLA